MVDCLEIIDPALITVLMVAGMARAAAPIQLNTKEGVLAWMNAYDPKHDLARAPSVMKTASDVGVLSDPEGAGMYVGFMAGLIGSNPKNADAIVGKLLAMRPADHWAVGRAIACSGHPDWRGLMTRFAPKMPTRELMAQRYIEGKLPTPDTPVSENKKTWRDRINPTKWFARKDKNKDKEIPLEERPENTGLIRSRLWSGGAIPAGGLQIPTRPHGGFRGCAYQISCQEFPSKAQANQYQHADDRQITKPWMQQIGDGHKNDCPRQIEQCGHAACGYETSNYRQIGKRLCAVRLALEAALHRSLKKSAREAVVGPYGDRGKQPSSCQIKETEHKKRKRNRHGQENKSVNTAAGQDAVIDLHHVQRSGKHENIFAKTEYSHRYE